MITEYTSQRIDFNAWLKQCPVDWECRFSGGGSENYAVYEFHFDDVIDEEDD